MNHPLLAPAPVASEPPEPAYTVQDGPALKLSVELVETRADGDGDDVTRLNVTISGALADVLADTLKHGAEVYLPCRLRMGGRLEQAGGQSAGLNVTASRDERVPVAERSGPSCCEARS